jgi:hypothetical protein
MVVLTICAFAIISAALVVAWNRAFRAVPWSVALTLWLLCAVYQGTTLLTDRVDLPANLAFVAYPWAATERPAVQANTGILFTQIAPWSRIARDILLTGEAPLWNRASASGAPLLANQQTAIYHPFTLAGLLLPIGKAFTLSAALRLFFVAFFTFVFLRHWDLSAGAAIFSTVAFTFCSFHVIWLLFPLGLSTMMLPLCLVGVQEFVSEARLRSYGALLAGLTLSVLGGHPESALWVWIATTLFSIFLCVTMNASRAQQAKRLAAIASAFLMAMMLTAFFWWPTLRVLRETPRYQAMLLHEANPADHGLSAEWLLPLITPNVLGTPANGTFTPPRGFHPAVLNDYGEVASGYAGLATLAFALAAPFVERRRAVVVAFGLMLCSFLTFAEAPVWRDLIREIPLAGISIHQRLRIFWNLGVCLAAAITLHAAIRGEKRRRIAVAVAVMLGAFATIYWLREPAFLREPLGATQMAIPLLCGAILLCALPHPRLLGGIATLLVFADLTVTTYRYNPSSTPADVYPVTGAIATLQRSEKPFRLAAWGWSFLPDTPGYYGVEDIKTTDPIQHAGYMRLMKGYLNADPTSYDQILRDASQPFFDYLNIKYVYVPPDQTLSDPRLVEIYRGTDGVVLENTEALPRYFLVERFSVEPDFGRAVWRSKQIQNFWTDALVDHVPARVLRAAPSLGQPGVVLGGGDVRIRRYRANSTTLHVESNGWNLLVSSDVHWPGWRAYWNGKRQPPVIVNGAFLGCFVPPGTGTLEFRYVPDEYTKGLRAAGAAAILLIALGIGRTARKRIASARH